ncbi:HEAT repeat domain-containing protein [Aquisphaera insulae]|uniref:HEAT repeat domain-containing protein n=1 Tax=Aquisphaera insulae TaxID=2712864 RepID=UPI0013ECB003|nr:HEAT repeat domain-containing protein [Aquisphaera insulae]
MAIGALGLAVALMPRVGAAQREAGAPRWIWHGKAPGGGFPAGSIYLRKVLRVKEPSTLAVDVTADNAFALYLDGKLVAEGSDWKTVQAVEAKLATGTHVLAAKATNESEGAAGFLIRGGVLPLGQGVPVQSDSSWKSTDKVPDGDDWKGVDFDDRPWSRARDLGALGIPPWGEPTRLAVASERFRVPAGFTINTVAQPTVTGSVVAFTFDPEGLPCVSIEMGPIARLHDDDHDGKYERRVDITPTMKNCQGLSFIGDALFAVGQGPKGAGLYRLTDPDRDGIFEATDLIRDTAGGMGEHGPHAVTLGPDGRLYYNNGNHAHLKPPIDASSPVNVAYEGELLPHYDDPRGHAAGVMAPGGEIYRSDDMGRSWKRVVAGFRNEYDFAFNAAGEIFTFDSDMEWDVGLPWYRPVRVCHCPIGAEFGWRNGSGKWPASHFDSLPAILDVGRGSPTGVTFYQAGLLPADYRDQFLICDWSQGRILAVKLDREGAGYRASSSDLVTGQPLNCTDIEVGPDGAVYFTTGGRGTQGGLFRVGVKGEGHKAATLTTAWDQAIAIDSPLSSFSRKKVETLRGRDPSRFDAEIQAIARGAEGKRPPGDRVRALDLLFEGGRSADRHLLTSLASDPMPEVRGRAISLLDRFASYPAVRDELTLCLKDPEAAVRRHACESLMQAEAAKIPVPELIPLLSDPDRLVRFAARTAIEHAGPAAHREELIAIADPRAAVEALLAIVRTTSLDQAAQEDLLRREVALLKRNAEPSVKLDVLRLIGLTYLQGPGKLELAGSGELADLLVTMFRPREQSPENRELARLLAFLDDPRAVSMILDHQADVADHATQIHDAYCLRAMKRGWTPESRRRLWAWYETASRWEGGYSFLGYLDDMIQELVDRLEPGEREALIVEGDRYPFPTRVLIRELELDRDPARIPALIALDGKLRTTPVPGSQGNDLRSLILEKLGRSSLPAARVALRETYVAEPARRDSIVRALVGHPSAADLPILASALASRDGNTTSLALGALKKIKESPQGPEGLAHLLGLAKRTGPSSRQVLDELASRWTGVPAKPDATPFEAALSAWEDVYRKKFPGGPALGAETAGVQSYDLTNLIDNVLQAPVMKTASADRGRQIILKARCLDCHKLGDQGAGLGPDLTTVSSRFRPTEILESIVTPSKVISDQYKTVTIAMEDGKVYQGMPVASDAANLVLLLSDGAKVTLPKAEIEDQKASTTSVMPEGLLNVLSYQDIADVLALFRSMPQVSPAEAAKAK